MNNKNTKPIKILLINANDYQTFTGADIYTHNLIGIINRNYNATITEYSYDMCIYKHITPAKPYDNVNVIYPSKVRNYRDEHMWLKWALVNFWNTVWKCKRQIYKMAPNYDLIISGALILYADKRVTSLPNYILVQHQSYDFVKMNHYKFWTFLARFVTYLYGARDCFKQAANIVLFTESDKQRILADSKSSIDRNIFFAPHSKYKTQEIDDCWIKKQEYLEQNNFKHDLIYVGRICKQQKRAHYLNAAAKILNLNIACVGDGSYYKKVEHDKAIKCYGILSSSKIADMYLMSKCSILVSDYEGMPGSATEAVAMGTPVITTVNIESIRYMQSKLGDAVQIISSRLKGKKLANEIQKRFDLITKDKTRYAQLCENCKNFAKEELSIEKFEKNWINTINSVIKR